MHRRAMFSALTFIISTHAKVIVFHYKMATLSIRRSRTLTCLPIIRHALYFSVGEDGHQGHGVESTGIQVPQDRTVGATGNLGL